MCGVIGIMNRSRDVAYDLYVGLWAMQHRGKESAKIVTFDKERFFEGGGMGEVPQAFWGKDLNELRGAVGIGHVRYSTTGESNKENVQPVKSTFHGHDFYIAHNGNLINVSKFKPGAETAECSDTRVMAELISKSEKENFEDALTDVLAVLEGSFSVVILFNGKLYAARDHFGFHPLQFGLRPDGFIVASESCVFDHLGAQLVGDVKPGAIVMIDNNLITAYQRQWNEEPILKIDIFEYIYFLRPDSIIHDVEAGKARYFMGRFLAEKYSIDADIVIPVPDSGNEACLGFYHRRKEMGDDIEFRPWALFRPHTVSRTFIEPVQEKREQYLFLKFNPRPDQLKGKRIIEIDDSIVRGTTQKVVSQILRKAGVKEINTLISSPMYLYPDFYGIDTYRKKGEIIAKKMNGNVAAIAKEIGVDYLGYLDLDSVIQAILLAGEPKTRLGPGNFYTGPFTGEYPAGKGDFEAN